MKGQDLINELIAMQQRCRDQHGISVSNLVKEKVGEDTFFGWIRAEFNRARLPLTVFPLKVRGQGRKYIRIVEALQHPAMARQIHFITTFPERLHKVLVDEAVHLGQWSHDDTVDALSLAFHPDIRISPRQFSSKSWRTHGSARLQQLSTPETIAPSARFAPYVQGEMPESKPWRAGTQVSTADGRYGKGDDFKPGHTKVSHEYDPGYTTTVDMGKMASRPTRSK